MILASAVLAATAVALPQAAHAEGLVRLRAGVSPTDYSLKFDENNPTSQKRGKTASSSYTAKNVGLTFISEGGVYLDLLGQTSGDATHDLWNPLPEQTFSRKDFTVTLGVSIPGQSGTGSFFGGYKSGSSELGAPKGTPVPGFGTPLWSKDIFDSKGFFFGGGYGFPAAGGQFGFNGAIAFMGGTWKDDAGFQNDADYTIGFSFGLSYTYMFGKNFGLTADFKAQHYSYGFNQYTTTAAYTVEEQINSFGLNAILQF
jgi:hypothetical protein